MRYGEKGTYEKFWGNQRGVSKGLEQFRGFRDGLRQ